LLDVKNFINSVLNNTIEYDDEFSNVLDEIALNKDLQKQFILAFLDIENEINKSNV
jgi:hypothetical protein